jgi:hypothetical protein
MQDNYSVYENHQSIDYNIYNEYDDFDFDSMNEFIDSISNNYQNLGSNSSISILLINKFENYKIFNIMYNLDFKHVIIYNDINITCNLDNCSVLNDLCKIGIEVCRKFNL